MLLLFWAFPHKFLHQFVEFCCEKFTHSCVVRFPINLCINLSNFVVSDVYALLLKTNPGDFHPKKILSQNLSTGPAGGADVGNHSQRRQLVPNVVKKELLVEIQAYDRLL